MVLEPRKLGLIPKEKRTERESYLYLVYNTARECVTGSMEKIRSDLDMELEAFYSIYDSDVEFRTAITDGLSDARALRLVELESALISLALGVEVTETRETVDADGAISTTTIHKRSFPNLSALQVLLEKYQGSSWTVSQHVHVETSNDPKEIDYNILSKAQLQILAAEVTKK